MLKYQINDKQQELVLEFRDSSTDDEQLRPRSYDFKHLNAVIIFHKGTLYQLKILVQDIKNRSNNINTIYLIIPKIPEYPFNDQDKDFLNFLKKNPFIQYLGTLLSEDDSDSIMDKFVKKILSNHFVPKPKEEGMFTKLWSSKRNSENKDVTIFLVTKPTISFIHKLILFDGSNFKVYRDFSLSKSNSKISIKIHRTYPHNLYGFFNQHLTKTNEKRIIDHIKKFL